MYCQPRRVLDRAGAAAVVVVMVAAALAAAGLEAESSIKGNVTAQTVMAAEAAK